MMTTLADELWQTTVTARQLKDKADAVRREKHAEEHAAWVTMKVPAVYQAVVEKCKQAAQYRADKIFYNDEEDFDLLTQVAEKLNKENQLAAEVRFVDNKGHGSHYNELSRPYHYLVVNWSRPE